MFFAKSTLNVTHTGHVDTDFLSTFPKESEKITAVFLSAAGYS